jgi:hypothetical protein
MYINLGSSSLPPDVSQESERAWPAVMGASVDEVVSWPSLATMMGRLGGTVNAFKKENHEN